MEADVKLLMEMSEELMKSSLTHLDTSLSHIRAGKANPRILENVRVEYYGSEVPLSNVATVTTPDAKTIMVQPWEKGMLAPIEKALINSDVGITPSNNGEVVRLIMPPLTEERRRTLVKQAKSEVEEAKISIRNARREVIEGVKKLIKEGLPEDMGKDAEDAAQKLHDKYIRKIEEQFTVKEKEIMTV